MMRRAAFLLVAGLTITGCAMDETLTAYGAAGKIWRVTELDGTRFPAAAFITFPEPARFVGSAPCNQFSGRITVPYPWFGTGRLVTTSAICPGKAAENTFLAALQVMTLAEITGDTLVLSTPEGRSMVFRADG